jgi:hypothetical protein
MAWSGLPGWAQGNGASSVVTNASQEALEATSTAPCQGKTPAFAEVNQANEDPACSSFPS